MYESRQQAAKKLATAVADLKLDNLALFALPRGGVVVGAELSARLHTPLGIVLVKKIGHPMSPEYAIGAVAENEEPIYNQEELASVDPRWLEREVTDARQIIKDRRIYYCGHDVITPLTKDHTAVLTDDGAATGLAIQAGVQALKDNGATRVVVAIPVASEESVAIFNRIADKVVVLDPPRDFKGSISAHYQRFEQISDKEVKRLLARTFTSLRQSSVK